MQHDGAIPASTNFIHAVPKVTYTSPLTTLPFFGVWWSFFDVRAMGAPLSGL